MPVKIDGSGYISGLAPMGACRLDKNGTNLLLSRFNGNQLFINGDNRPIPAAGVTLAQAALTASAVNYVYAAWSAGAIVLEPSATAPVIETTYGTKVKTGDASRALVGMCYPKAGPTLTDTAAARLVLSWFNQRPLDLLAYLTANRTSTNTGFVEVNAEIRIEFLCWANNTPELSAAGSVTNSVNGGAVRTGIAIDSTTTPIDGGNFTSNPPGVNSIQMPMGFTSKPQTPPAEGYHYATLLGATVGGSSTSLWVGAAAASDRTALLGSTLG